MFALSETEDPVWIVHACGDPGERSELFLPLPIVVSASETPSRRKNAGAYSGFCWPQFGDPSNTPAPALPVNQSRWPAASLIKFPSISNPAATPGPCARATPVRVDPSTKTATASIAGSIRRPSRPLHVITDIAALLLPRRRTQPRTIGAAAVMGAPPRSMAVNASYLGLTGPGGRGGVGPGCYPRAKCTLGVTMLHDTVRIVQDFFILHARIGRV